jgi:hypothetical protein
MRGTDATLIFIAAKIVDASHTGRREIRIVTDVASMRGFFHPRCLPQQSCGIAMGLSQENIWIRDFRCFHFSDG